ncbi:MAG: HAMP domain-containing sensor histidine kinase [Candidatus Saccharimonadales bacterium]
MAVALSKAQRAAGEYLRAYARRSVYRVLIGATSTGILLTTLLTIYQILTMWTWHYWVTLICTSALFTIVGMLLLWLQGKPMYNLIQSLAAIADTSQQSPMQPIDQQASIEFQDILQPFYDLSSPSSALPTVAEPEEYTAITTGLDQASCGIIMLNNEKEIIYNNKNAPITIGRDGLKSIALPFPDDDSLDTWIEQCRDSKIHNEHTWTRIANKETGAHGRHIYDITASYKAHSLAEVVLLFFDRSETYTPEEDDLDFISFAAHELRGPITVIRGYLDVINEEVGPSMQLDQQELMKRLIVSANRLSTYINNILGASRFDRRHFKLHVSEEHLSAVYDTIRDDMDLRAASQRRLLTIDIPDSLPTVAADRNSIGEVFSNLIDNAIKYSNEGGMVTVTARHVSNVVEVAITDRGIGMPANVVNNLFHKFYRSHRSRETVAGTGIGLYLSKAIVESHGGVIEVRSTENEGSTFSFTLPVYETVAETLKPGKNSNNEKLITRGDNHIRNHSMFRG